MQNGTIHNRESLNLKEYEAVKAIIYAEEGHQQVLKKEYQYLDKIKAEKISYESDGLQITGYLVYPNKPGKYPGIIYCRGGNKDFGQLTPAKIAFILGRIASWGYVLVGSQYRGNDGSEGHEEFGGADVGDVLNLIPLLQNHEMVEEDKLGIYGWSRGGMMTYLSLKRTHVFKAACVGGGLSDLFKMKETRPVMEEVYQDLIPGYRNQKETSLTDRSALYFADKISKTTPILMLHGSSDWRVVPQMALDLSKAFIFYKVPHRLILFEGGDHGLTGHRKEVDQSVRMWFRSYLKNDKALPNLDPHGR